MGDLGELVVRMIVSLAVVLGLIAAAYAVARRRQGRGSASAFRRRAKVQAPTLEVEARAGLARGAAAVAVRFADRIVLIGVTDGAASTVLAEISAADWDRAPAELETDDLDTDDDSSNDAVRSPTSALRTPFDPNGVVSERPSFLDALRDVTSRRP